MEWGDLFSLHGVVTPQDAHKLGLMVAAMVNASLEKAVEDAVGANIDAFRAGLQEGLAQNSLDISDILKNPLPPQDVTPVSSAQTTDGAKYIVPVPWDTAH